MTDRERVTERLREAHESVVAADLPEYLQADALRLAFEALGERGNPRPPVADNAGGGPADGEDNADQPTVSQDTFIQQLADRSNVAEATLREIYFLGNDGKVGLNLRGQNMGNTMRARVLSITTLLAGAYRLGLGISVSSSDIRDVANSYQSLDGNFATYMRTNPSVSYTGSRNSKAIDLRAGAEGTYKDLVESLVD